MDRSAACWLWFCEEEELEMDEVDKDEAFETEGVEGVEGAEAETLLAITLHLERVALPRMTLSWM